MSVKFNVIIIEDEPSMLNFMKITFESANFNVFSYNKGKEAIIMISTIRPDLIILDLGIPDMDGLNVIQKLRTWSNTPLIVVSEGAQEQEKVMAFEMGADDYIIKPFDTGELLARARTAVRHSPRPHLKNSCNCFISGDMKIDFANKTVFINRKVIHLTQNEYSIIEILSKNAGKIITYNSIIRCIWNGKIKDGYRALRVNVANIRRKIEEDTSNPEYIVTEIGIGYRMNRLKERVR